MTNAGVYNLQFHKTTLGAKKRCLSCQNGILNAKISGILNAKKVVLKFYQMDPRSPVYLVRFSGTNPGLSFLGGVPSPTFGSATVTATMLPT